MLREFPCVRAGGDRAYIDLFGIDARRRAHIVETKIGDDAWARGHHKVLATRLGHRTVEPIHLDFVVATPKSGRPAIGPYTEPQALALHGSIPWRFGHCTKRASPRAASAVPRVGSCSTTRVTQSMLGGRQPDDDPGGFRLS